MTALAKYQRLEASALWHEAPGARGRDVIVGLRDATIVLSDPRSEAPLAQWSLPAIERLNPGQMPARFAPGLDAGEEIELDDAEMISALDTVHRALERRKPRPGRLRGLVLAGFAIGLVGVLVFWLPGQVTRYAEGVLPAPTRAELGDLALADLARLTGQPCKSVPGRRAASLLAERLFPKAPPRIEVLREGLVAPAALPGDILLLPRAMVETADGPDTMAGLLLQARLQGLGQDPLDEVLAHLGLGATLGLLTTGSVAEEALQGFGETLLARPAPPPPDAGQLLALFKVAKVSSTPFGAASKDRPALVSHDPYPQGSPEPVLRDEDWLEFQAICSE